MNGGFIKYWAIGATAIALVLLGVLIGQHFGKPPKPEVLVDKGTETKVTSRATANPNNDRTASSGGEAAEEPRDFVIPAAFTSIPSEWHTIVNDDSFDGYAILFDPPRREVIIEKCRHPGYFDTEANRPLPPGLEFCTNVLWGQLLTMDEHSAKVLSRNGKQLELSLSLKTEDGQSQLGLSFPGHQMKLVPGSKNDLYQILDRKPAMVEQKRQKLLFDEAGQQERRQ